MTRLILLGLLLVGSGFAQTSGANVINVRVLTNQTVTTTTTYNSNPLQNIGQTSHFLKVDASGIIGTSFILVATIQGSFDGVVWNNAGPTNTSPNFGSATASSYGIGVGGYQYFPYIRTSVKVEVLSGFSIVVNASYTGSSSPSANLVDSYGNYMGMKYTGPISMTAGGSLVSAISGSPTNSVVVYGMFANLASSSTFMDLSCGHVITKDVEFMQIANPSPLISIPIGLRPMIVCPIGDAVFYQSTDTGGGAEHSTSLV